MKLKKFFQKNKELLMNKVVHVEKVAVKTLEALQLDCGLVRYWKNEFSNHGNSELLAIEEPKEEIEEMVEYSRSYPEQYKGILDWLNEVAFKIRTESIAPEIKCICLELINTLLSQTDDSEFRVHLRNGMVRNGLYEYLADLKTEKNLLGKTQFETFQTKEKTDADELQEHSNKCRMDMEDIRDCFEVLKNADVETPPESYFLSILKHLQTSQDDIHIRPAFFKIIEENTSQLKSGPEPDISYEHSELKSQCKEDESKEKPIENDISNIEELKEKLEVALAAKSEAETQLDVLIEKGEGENESIKLHPNNISMGVVPPPPPMPVAGVPPPPPPMPALFGNGVPPPPPMPGMSGPPPPPMPGMGGQPGMTSLGRPSGMKTLPHGVKPKKKWKTAGPLKKVNWKTIPPQKMTEESFWLKVEEEALASHNILDELAQKFSSKPSKQSADMADKGYSSGTPKKVKELKVLDSKAAQNISILLGGCLKHMEYNNIKKCLLRCDGETLRANVVEQLIQYLPPADQLNKLRQFKDSYNDLTEAEQFCLTISEVDRLLPRLKSLSFKQHYQEMVQDAEPDIVAASAACEEVRKSKKFHKILELILLLGNYMNTGSKNGEAFGFEMSSLTKLNGTKDVHNKSTLLHFIVETVEKQFPELLDFHEEMPNIDKASRVSIENILKTLKEMDTCVRNLQTDLNNNKMPQSEDDKFLEVMEAFAKLAREQCDVMQGMLKNVEKLYQDLAEYYVFDGQKYKLKEFFTDLKSFKDSFINARRDNEKEREREKNRERARLAKEKSDRERTEKKARKEALIDNLTETHGCNMMDSLLVALHNGSVFGREKNRRRTQRTARANKAAQLDRSRSRTRLIVGKESTSEIMTC